MVDSSTGQLRGEGVVAIIERDGRYLMIRRPDEVRAGGYWCFVGGAIEEGETQQQALVREVQEEVGLEVRPVEKVWQCLSITREWLLHCWIAAMQTDELHPNPREVSDYRWMTPQEIADWPQVIPSVIDFFMDQGLLPARESEKRKAKS